MLLLLFLALSCSKNDDDTPVLVKSSEKQLVSFAFNAIDNAVLETNQTATVNEGYKTITASMPVGTDISALTPTMNVSAKASVAPTGAQNFSSPVTYTVTAEDGTIANYIVEVMVSDSSESQLLRFVFREADNGIPDTIEATVDTENASLLLVTTSNTDLTALIPQLEISEGASYSPQGVQDFSGPVTYTVTAADGTQSDYAVTVKTERDLLITIIEANPNNTLGWNLADADIENWNVGLDQDGYIEELYIEEANLSVLPEEIGFFGRLQKLSLDDNQLAELPESIGNLINLTWLSLYRNNLTELPSEFAQLSALEDLYLGENLIQEFPEELFQLTNLIKLYLDNNLLKELPTGFDRMTALDILYLDDNLFEKFPEQVFELTNLTRFYYRNNQLKELPSEIGNLTNLVRLSLEGNLLSTLPDEVQSLSRLKTLRLDGNQFEAIPEVVIFTLDVLETLGLDDNMIQEISPEITNLSSLEYLYLDNNLLTSLPSELASIASLSSLEIRGNPIAVLPEELCSRVDIEIVKDDTTICK